ncbi:MAG: glutamine--fructose-6-phosphate transaminase (isomerizing) [Dehalococcoidales bacterium]
MCGIIGYVGGRRAQPILFDSLKRLEYRGYDSCGIAVCSGGITLYKNSGKVGDLERNAPRCEGSIGIGHTRWATHGEPNQVNSHPHCDCSGRFAVVHNGIIENYSLLKKELQAEGHHFVSDTDSEVIAHLIEKYYRGGLEAAVSSALAHLEGFYAVIALAEGERVLVAARKGNPLIIGIGDRENFVASDVPAVLDNTDRVVYLDDGDIGIIGAGDIRVTHNGAGVDREEKKILWSIEDARKAGYEHFMLKEIYEQPRVIRDTLTGWLSSEGALGESLIDLTRMQTGERPIIILACGTSYHAALVGRYIIEKVLGIPVVVELASEVNYYERHLGGGAAIALSQSGETADTLRAMRKLKAAGCRLLAITNVVDSSVTRIANDIIYTRAGPEIGVAATKSFIVQLMVLYSLAVLSCRVDARSLVDLVMELRRLPERLQHLLSESEGIEECAGFLARFEDAFFIGRGISFPVALEGALKLKEISYIHAEGYAAGELKHGSFALLGEDTPVVAILARDNTYAAMLSNIKEVKARKAPVIALAEEGDETIGEFADMVISVPEVDPLFSPVVNVVALQLLAYFTARDRNCPIDTPRNLAKSVTVE